MIYLVSGNGNIERRETPQTHIYQYSINLGKQVQIDFELPYSIDLLKSGQKVNVLISNTKPKKTQALLTLRGEVYQIEKTSAGIRYVISFSGLQGSVSSKRKLPGIKLRKPVYLQISD